MADPNRWHDYFLGLALQHARMSKDPSTQVGAQLVGPDGETLCGGFNGFPRGIADLAERLADRDLKLKLTVHAEINAIMTAARLGIPTKGCTLYLAATDDTGAIWGGPPCTRCTVELIQAGIRRIVSRAPKPSSSWADDLALAHQLIIEAGLAYRTVDPP